MDNSKKWYAVYTKPRWEKKVHLLCDQQHIESYCPLNKVRKKWSDRIKLVHEPLFKSYVFVHVSEAEKTKVREVGGVLNYVYAEGKPAVIREEEIDMIRKFLDEFEDVQAEPVDVKVDSRVTINTGALMNQSGIVRRVLGNKVEVLIESMGYLLVAHVSKAKVSNKD